MGETRYGAEHVMRHCSNVVSLEPIPQLFVAPERINLCSEKSLILIVSGEKRVSARRYPKKTAVHTTEICITEV